MGVLQAIINYFIGAASLTGVTVSGPLANDAPAPSGQMVILDAAGAGGGSGNGPETLQAVTARCYGGDDVEAIDAYERLVSATYIDATRTFPRVHVDVGGRIVKWVSVLPMNGPLDDNGTPMVVATLMAKLL